MIKNLLSPDFLFYLMLYASVYQQYYPFDFHPHQNRERHGNKSRPTSPNKDCLTRPD